LPTLEAPAATHTGWNLRKIGFGESELCDNNDTMIPFAATGDERLKTNDPRPSMGKRNLTASNRPAAIAKAPQRLVLDRLSGKMPDCLSPIRISFLTSAIKAS